MSADPKRDVVLRLVDESDVDLLDDGHDAKPGEPRPAEPSSSASRSMADEGAGVSPNARWVLTGPFARIHDRAELLEDLTYAVRPRTSNTVLALFGFKGLRQRLEAVLEPDDNKLLGTIARYLADSVGPTAVLYEPRRGDFCGLFDGRLEVVEPLVEKIVAGIDAETRPLGIETAVGIVSLPSEAHTPIAALDLADRRRREVAGDLRPTPRGSVYARITAALRQSHYLSDASG